MTNKPLSPDVYCNVLTVIDEYSRFLFAFSTKHRSSNTVINCLKSLFTLFGPPATIHSDSGPEFFSMEFSAFLSHWGIQHSRTTAYHSAGNDQTERYNGTIWKTVQSILADRQLPDVAWPTILSEALHCIRSLINTTTGETPHERFCVFPRSYYQVPNNIIPSGSYAWLRRHTRHKNDLSGDMAKSLLPTLTTPSSVVTVNLWILLIGTTWHLTQAHRRQPIRWFHLQLTSHLQQTQNS